jgi:hypothetical protein
MRYAAHRPRKGQSSDASAALAHLSRFVETAFALNEAWNEVLDRGYPRYLPSFDEFMSELLTWREVVTERQEVTDDDDILPLNFADPAEVRRWIKDMRGQVDDAAGAGEDATRPVGKRALGRLMARRTVIEARHALLELLEAAERGLEKGAEPPA